MEGKNREHDHEWELKVTDLRGLGCEYMKWAELFYQDKSSIRLFLTIARNLTTSFVPMFELYHC
jgi:hypothetical protein